MTVTYADRVQETFTTTGTGAISLAGAVVGYQAFSAVLSNGATCYYAATDGTGWEVGLGTYASVGNMLTRTTVLSSSNSGSPVSWITGTKSIWLDLPASAIQGFQTPIMTPLGIGSIILAKGPATSVGGTAPYTLIVPQALNASGALANTGDTVAGTWQALQTIATNYTGLWQRIS